MVRVRVMVKVMVKRPRILIVIHEVHYNMF